jgi:DNA-binding GntR family transcriptional regulator
MVVGEKYRTMQEIVYSTIKERILSGEYSPGQRLITNDLATELGVSRMPIREALQRLEAATGLVTLIPHKGAVVNVISQEDILEVFHIRAVLEGLAARLACPNISESELKQLEETNNKVIGRGHMIDEENFLDLNQQFHAPIWKAANSPRLVGMLQSLYDASRSYRYMSVMLPGRFEEIVGEHAEIVAALRKRDADEVEKVVNNHYRQTLVWLMRSMKDAAGKPASIFGSTAPRQRDKAATNR